MQRTPLPAGPVNINKDKVGKGLEKSQEKSGTSKQNSTEFQDVQKAKKVVMPFCRPKLKEKQ